MIHLLDPFVFHISAQTRQTYCGQRVGIESAVDASDIAHGRIPEPAAGEICRGCYPALVIERER